MPYIEVNDETLAELNIRKCDDLTYDGVIANLLQKRKRNFLIRLTIKPKGEMSFDAEMCVYNAESFPSKNSLCDTIKKQNSEYRDKELFIYIANVVEMSYEDLRAYKS